MTRALVPLLLLLGCEPQLTAQEWSTLDAMRLTPDAWAVPAAELDDTPAKIALGRELFYDCSLTSPVSDPDSELGEVGATGVLSCASCHDPNDGGANPRQDAPGVAKLVDKHTPSVLNAAWRTRFGWKGGHTRLESQVAVPLTGSLHAVAPRALRPHLYQRHLADWEAAFGPLGHDADEHLAGVSEALAAYLRSLSTPARFDGFLDDGDGLTEEELAGARLFVGKAGCSGCHDGPLLSDGKLHDLGETDGTDHDKAELDCTSVPPTQRAACVQEREDAGLYLTPTLRNVGRTAPYMHDGSLPRLWDVLAFYNHGGEPSRLGTDHRMAPLNLDESEMEALEAFLLTLDGDAPLEPDREVLCPLP